MVELVAPSLGDERTHAILLVEDEILIRLVAAELLREAGFDVIEAADAEEAIILLKAGLEPALVVTDIRMPGSMGGIALTEWIKQRSEHIPVILLSSHLDLGAEHRADAFVAKPFRASELQAVVSRLMERAWSRGRSDELS